MLNVVDIQYGSGTDAMSASDLRAASGHRPLTIRIPRRTGRQRTKAKGWRWNRSSARTKTANEEPVDASGNRVEGT